MLVIRLQRVGRKGHAMFRVVVQDSRKTPTSGKIVYRLGSYDPHLKKVSINKDKAKFYLDHGAQPSIKASSLLKDEGIKMPKWITIAAKKKRATKYPDKRKSTRPKDAAIPKPELTNESPQLDIKENTNDELNVDTANEKVEETSVAEIKETKDSDSDSSKKDSSVTKEEKAKTKKPEEKDKKAS